MPFLSRNYLEDESFSKVLFYSVLIHYLFLFFLFGNPFLIRPSGGGKSSPQSDNRFSVDLLSIPKRRDSPKKVSSPTLHPTMRVDEEAFFETGAEEEGTVAATSKSKTVLSEAGLRPLESTKPLPSVLRRKFALRVPPSMTGPEDCMLKVVGMVCPRGEVGCIAAYKAFCATLPD